MGADGGGEEGGPDVDDGPPGVCDLGGRGRFLFELRGGGAGGVAAGDECVDGLRPVFKDGVIGGDLKLELFVGGLRLRLCQRLFQPRCVLLALF